MLQIYAVIEYINLINQQNSPFKHGIYKCNVQLPCNIIPVIKIFCLGIVPVDIAVYDTPVSGLWMNTFSG